MVIGRCIDNFGNPEYTLIKNNLRFKMYYGDDSDLYWKIENTDVNFGNFRDYEEKPLEFRISEEDGDVYFIFSELYKSVISSANKIDAEEKRKEKEKLEATDVLVYVDDREEASTTELPVKGGGVVWHSEEEVSYDDANFVTITPFTGDILITFRKGSADYEFPGVIPIRFRSNGSRFTPFNECFMQHFVLMHSAFTTGKEKEENQHKRKLTNN